MKMLAVDIGNSNISFGIFKGKKMIRTFNLATGSFKKDALKTRLAGQKIETCLIASVVPGVTQTVVNSIRQVIGCKPRIIGKDIKVPMKNLYRYPEKLGIDRLLNAYAGAKLYGKPLIIADFGTAVTFDIVSKKGEYLGGMILPGLQLCLNALTQNTALLPQARLKKPGALIGKDTKSSILSGVIFGYAALTEGLAKRISSEIGKARVIGTGGNIGIISRFCPIIDKTDPQITLKAINLCYQGDIHAKRQ